MWLSLPACILGLALSVLQGVSSRLHDAPPQPVSARSSGSGPSPPLQFVISQPAEGQGLGQRGSPSGGCSGSSGASGSGGDPATAQPLAAGPGAAAAAAAAAAVGSAPIKPVLSTSPEQIVVLMDCRGASTLNAARISWVFKAVASSLSHHYPGRCGAALGRGWGMGCCRLCKAVASSPSHCSRHEATKIGRFCLRHAPTSKLLCATLPLHHVVHSPPQPPTHPTPTPHTLQAARAGAAGPAGGAWLDGQGSEAAGAPGHPPQVPCRACWAGPSAAGAAGSAGGGRRQCAGSWWGAGAPRGAAATWRGRCSSLRTAGWRSASAAAAAAGSAA